jgi:hypothetical protein
MHDREYCGLSGPAAEANGDINRKRTGGPIKRGKAPGLFACIKGEERMESDNREQDSYSILFLLFLPV